VRRQAIGVENDGVSRQLARFVKETGENDRRLRLPRACHPRGRLLVGRTRARAAAAGHARLITAALGYDTELRWDADPEPDVVGYEIVWRDSIDPLWTHARNVGNVTDATITGLNKDDVQVAVRAIDKDGNRSPAAYPVPAAS
jgi:hypothetical protein